MSSAPIVIAGAGVAGLITALSLHRHGIPFQVYEQVAQLSEVGACLQLSPNGTRVLIDLGLDDAMRQVVCEAERKEVRHGLSGQTWKLFDLGEDCRMRFAAPYWFIHRGDFQQVLLTALRDRAPHALQVGIGVQSVQDQGDHISVQLSDGRSVHASGLLASDGVRSRLRSAMVPNDPVQFTGLMAWRGVVPMARLPAHLRVTAEHALGTNWVGPGGHVITYPLRRAQLMNVVGILERDDWHHESWNQTGSHEELLADFAIWHDDVRELMRSIEQPYKWALLGRAPLSAYAQGRLCLMGDAAHPTLPFWAQGANMAIEDGAIMARCLANAPVPLALLAFERLRLQRTTQIVQRSLDNASRFHNPVLADASQAQAYISAEWQADKVRTRYDWLFEYDPLAVELTLPQA
ncbi:MAG: FAD-dependent monooxygenase [Alphaproteobacteria bacterium]|nr:FAD-dependent monooxygenase [Alphaproteobacteria bacterium]